MISLSAIGICNAIHGRHVGGPLDRVVSGGVCTDTRALRPHCVFVALSGEKFDGNLFAPQASKEAAVVIVSRVEPGMDESCAVLLVDDTLKALQDLATWWRSCLSPIVIGLTGSNGKTSTKDLCASVLAQGFKTIATKGNLNNHIGVPLSILEASPDVEAAVWEMGMNHRGELAPLCAMTQPTIGIITSIGSSHIEFLGTRENIALEKCTVAKALPADGYMIYPVDCAFAEMIQSSTEATCISCGIEQGVVQAKDLCTTSFGSRFALHLPEREPLTVELPIHGRHMVCNALLAAATGWVCGLSTEQIAQGLSAIKLTHGRLHCEKINDILVIDDTYNANPDSMVAALVTTAELPCRGRRIAVLGKMGELGDFSEKGHIIVGKKAEELAFDIVISVGDQAQIITQAITNSGTETHHFSSAEEAATWLKSTLHSEDIILFKGSRSARMEETLKKTFSTN